MDSSWAMASSGSSTLMVCIPRARAGLRLTPRSSRKTASLGSIPSCSHASCVEGGVGLAHAHLARLDDPVEQPEYLGHLALTVDVPFAHHEVVRQQPGDESLGAAPHRLHHLRPQLAGQAADDLVPHHLVPGGEGFGFEQPAELGQRHFAALEFGPGVGIRVGGVQLSDEPVRQTAFLLVVRKRFERRREDDATEVEEDGPNRGHDRRSRAVASQSSVERTRESMSIRSLSPWNIEP